MTCALGFHEVSLFYSGIYKPSDIPGVGHLYRGLSGAPENDVSLIFTGPGKKTKYIGKHTWVTFIRPYYNQTCVIQWCNNQVVVTPGVVVIEVLILWSIDYCHKVSIVITKSPKRRCHFHIF